MSAQVVVAIPLLVMLPLMIIQFTLWAFAAHAAQAAAAQALNAARVAGATASSGQLEAHQVLDQLASGPLTSRKVTVTRTADTVSVTITGSSESIVPGLHLRVHAEASGPVEIFTPGVP